MERTRHEMAVAINDLSRGQFFVSQSGFDQEYENLYWFELSTKDVLSFTPFDSDKTLSQGLWNHGLIRT
ncbi:hypothetical protein NVP1238A_53 [Vibrio phage 1.238.A._10N.261.52.F10]|uniref:Uncharacterized protein n=1 Tax=Vibrio phage 1.238.A._10N.261.52.F10 TaxID=1881231 RepID=A0A2I7RUF2_9CAUD|nr:hypothetical protein KNT79_gp53 [Vibrio phage 1.238.A._10N.261.52.F10]AUR97302.1 hypothetical protein NVP1238A_53 [Vibrio phage 1.238.A._10N.261.52.F10]AUR97396.1 hypothetical protein NVP1238B_54 [Vibrio phage 1.238.B._10N.261.52.F10]